MELTTGIIALALILGIKHSFDADHIVAVSTYMTRAKKIKPALRSSVYWAAGHMLTASVITYLLFSFKELFLSAYLSSFESLVAVMLIVLGVFAMKDVRNLHMHKHYGVAHIHLHPHEEHKHMLGIGIIHGLASNDELLVLITAEIGLTSLFGMLIGLFVFSVGVVLGMLVFSSLVAYPAIKYGSKIQRGIITASGVLSILYGCAMLLPA